MKLSEPKVITWWIAVILGVVGIVASFVSIAFLSDIAIWLLIAGFVILAVATLFKGL